MAPVADPDWVMFVRSCCSEAKALCAEERLPDCNACPSALKSVSAACVGEVCDAPLLLLLSLTDICVIVRSTVSSDIDAVAVCPCPVCCACICCDWN